MLLPDPKFELRTHAYVKELVYDKQAKKVKAVRYVDTRSGEEFEQPAGIVLLGAYVFNNMLLMLTAGIGEQYDPVTGKGTIGKNYCYQVSGNGRDGVLRGQGDQPVHGGGRLARHEHRRFQRRQLRSFGPGLLRRRLDFGRPLERPADRTRPVPPGTPRWGREWKKATAKWYNHSFGIGASGSQYAHRENYLDLDPTYRDALGRPLVRMTFNFHENDYKLGAVHRRRARQDRHRDEADHQGQRRCAARQLQRRALSVDAQYRRHDHGRPTRRTARSTDTARPGTRTICS